MLLPKLLSNFPLEFLSENFKEYFESFLEIRPGVCPGTAHRNSWKTSFQDSCKHIFRSFRSGGFRNFFRGFSRNFFAMQQFLTGFYVGVLRELCLNFSQISSQHFAGVIPGGILSLLTKNSGDDAWRSTKKLQWKYRNNCGWNFIIRRSSTYETSLMETGLCVRLRWIPCLWQHEWWPVVDSA